jgi:hypothetical protein
MGLRTIANRGVKLPLPNIKVQCTANNRTTGQRCKNPAAYGCKTCRYHGARKNVVKGEDHPKYKHGERTNAAIDRYRQKMAELDRLEQLGRLAGVITGERRRGRKFSG